MNINTAFLTLTLLTAGCGIQEPGSNLQGSFSLILPVEPVNQRANSSINGVIPDWSCGPTSLSMILKYYKKIQNPHQTVTQIYPDIMVNGQAYYGNAMKVGQTYGLVSTAYADMNLFLQESNFMRIFQENKLIYLSTHQWKPGFVGHLVVAHGISSAGVHIADPWGGQRVVMPMAELRKYSKSKYAVVFGDPTQPVPGHQSYPRSDAEVPAADMDEVTFEEAGDTIAESTEQEATAVAEQDNLSSEECDVGMFACTYGGNCNLRDRPSASGTKLGQMDAQDGSFQVCEIRKQGGTLNTWVRILVANIDNEALPIDGYESVWVYAGESYSP